MKTLADVKRAMTVGTHWEGINANGYSLGVREIVDVASTKVGFLTKKGDKEVVSWCYFPKSKDVKFTGDWIEFWRLWYRPGSDELENLPVLKFRQV